MVCGAGRVRAGVHGPDAGGRQGAGDREPDLLYRGFGVAGWGLGVGVGVHGGWGAGDGVGEVSEWGGGGIERRERVGGRGDEVTDCERLRGQCC